MVEEGMRIIRHFKKIKEDNSIDVIDAHCHPFDVMGIVNPLLNHSIVHKDYYKPSVMEILRYHPMTSIALRVIFKTSKKIVEESIKKYFIIVGEQRCKQDMVTSLVDKMLLIPIEPYLKIEMIASQFQDRTKFFLAGSVNIHQDSKEEIERKIKMQIKEYKIVALKLHPNLQGFFPIPSMNDAKIKGNLELIYELANQHALPVIFHGGWTNLPKLKDNESMLKSTHHSRKADHARLENFIGKSSGDSLFKQLHTPIIIAHLGHYAMMHCNFSLLKFIAKNYTNVHFDTAGIYWRWTKKAIEVLGSDRIIFGSDTQYNSQFWSLIFTYKACMLANTSETENIKVKKIFSENFQKIINQ